MRPVFSPEYSVGYFFKTIIEFLIFLFFILTFLTGLYNIPSGSMEPSILRGDILLVDLTRFQTPENSIDRLFFPGPSPRRGDLVVFKINEKSGPAGAGPLLVVKRVIGLPGETVRMINGHPHIYSLRESSLFSGYPSTKPGKVLLPACRGMVTLFSLPGLSAAWLLPNSEKSDFWIPPDHYFCLGDNRGDSRDSRDWGPIPRSSIIGSPWRTIWSLRPGPRGAARSRPAGILRAFVNFIPYMVSHTRWNRILHRYR